jgi:hypothetical protein
MAQTVINTAATTANTSTTQTISAGVSATFAIYAASGAIDAGQRAVLYYDTPGGNVPIPGGALGIHNPIVQVAGPAQVICVKDPATASFGVLIET